MANFESSKKYSTVLPIKLVWCSFNQAKKKPMKAEEIHKIIKDFFADEEKVINDAIEYHRTTDNIQMKVHWKEAKATNERIKKALFNKLKIK